jgi:sodium pump decarboxylase gamma subunit
MNIELWKDGLLLMVIGMGFVFFFLAIMIWVMNLNAKIIRFLGKYFPEAVEEEQTSTKKKSVNNNDSEIALAVACAFAAAKGGKKC